MRIQSGLFAELSDCLRQRGRGDSVCSLEEVCLCLSCTDSSSFWLDGVHMQGRSAVHPGRLAFFSPWYPTLTTNVPHTLETFFSSMPPLYTLLPTESKDAKATSIDLEASHRPDSRITFKKVALYSLAALAVMYAVMLGIKEVPSACRMWRSKSMAMKGAIAHGANRTMSTGLPSHFTLPSGDKIPSVALGNVSHTLSLKFHSYPYQGVWRADRDRVGAAVKVCTWLPMIVYKLIKHA